MNVVYKFNIHSLSGSQAFEDNGYLKDFLLDLTSIVKAGRKHQTYLKFNSR